MSILKPILRAGLVVPMLWLVSGCSQERPTRPVPARHYLYTAVHTMPPKNSYVLTIDCKTDSIVDSLPWVLSIGSFGRSQVFPTPRPGIVVLPTFDGHKVVDMTNHIVVASLGGQFNSIVFLPEYGRIVGALDDSTIIFEDTSFTVRSVLRDGMIDCKRIAQTTRLIAALSHNTSRWPLLVYDVTAGQFVDSMLIDPESRSVDFAWSGFTISRDGTRVYGSGSAGSSWFVYGIDLSEKRLLFKYPGSHFCYGANCYTDPTDREVWIEYGWDPYSCGGSGGVFILDASTGVRTRSLPLEDIVTVGGWFWRVAFVLDGSRAYIACPSLNKNALVTLDPQTLELTKVRYLPEDHMPLDVAIGPAP